MTQKSCKSSVVIPFAQCRRYFPLLVCWTLIFFIGFGFYRSPTGPAFRYGFLLANSTSKNMVTKPSKSAELRRRNQRDFYPRLNWTELELEQQKRQRRLHEMCAMYRNGSRIPAKFARGPLNPDYRHLVIDRCHKIAWCPVFKAASSSWMINFISLGRAMVHEGSLSTKATWYEKHVNMMVLEAALKLKKKITLAAQVRRYFPALPSMTGMKLLMNYTSFFIVRHPFERLLSAYRDKLENRETKEYYYRKYGKRMVQIFRNKTKHEVTTNSSIEESTPRPEPTFLEYIQYILVTGDMDEHWRPYFAHCSPCQINYRVVMKFETLHQDQWYLIKKLNLAHIIHPRWRNANSAGLTSRMVSKYYYSQIPRSHLESLYRLYQVDFDIFDYDPTEYIQMGYIP